MLDRRSPTPHGIRDDVAGLASLGPRLVLHVGLHKTGTTTMQEWLLPLLPGATYLGKSRASDTPRDPAVDADARAFVYSDEILLGHLTPCYIAAFRDRESWARQQVRHLEQVARAFPEARIIVSLRRHASWVLSVYKHHLRYGGRDSFARFFRLDGSGQMGPADFELAPRVAAAVSLFGDRAHFVWFESLIGDAGPVIGGIAAFAGLPCPGSGAGLIAPRLNKGLNRAQARLIRGLNRVPVFGGSDNFLLRRDAVATRLRGRRVTPYGVSAKVFKQGAPLELDPQLERDIMAHFRDDLERCRDMTEAPGRRHPGGATGGTV